MEPHSTVGGKRAAAVILRLIALICLLGTVAGEAGAAQLRGSTLSIGAKQVPLPQAGKDAWTVLSEQQVDLRSITSDGTIALDSVVAGAADDRTFRYLVVARANRAPAVGGFGLAGACRRSDLHSTRTITRDGSTVAICTFVSHVLNAAPGDADPGWVAALRAVERSGRKLPETWLVVGVRIADPDDLLDVRYYFNPESIGMIASAPASDAPPPSGRLDAARSKLAELLGAASGPPHDSRWLASDWSVTGVAGDARRLAAVADLAAWAEGVHPLAYAGFKGRLAEDLAPPPAWTHGTPVLVSNGVGDLPGETALWKTLSWRALGSSLDAIVSFALTGSLGVAGGVTVIGGVANAVVYYLHEKAWETFGGSRGPGDLITELLPAGIER